MASCCVGKNEQCDMCTHSGGETERNLPIILNVDTHCLLHFTVYFDVSSLNERGIL